MLTICSTLNDRLNATVQDNTNKGLIYQEPHRINSEKFLLPKLELKIPQTNQNYGFDFIHQS